MSKAKKDRGKRVVRVVRVKTQAGEFRGPVVKLCLLRRTEEGDALVNQELINFICIPCCR